MAKQKRQSSASESFASNANSARRASASLPKEEAAVQAKHSHPNGRRRFAHDAASHGTGRARFRIFRARSGQIRLVWLWLLGFIAYFAWNWGVELLFGLALNRLWNVAQLSPWIAAGNAASLRSIVESAGTILIFLGLSRALHLDGHAHGEASGLAADASKPARAWILGMLKWAALGLAAALAGTGLCLLTDSLRLELPLSEPNFDVNTLVALPVCLLSTLAGEMFMLSYLYHIARDRMRPLAAILLLTAVEFIAEAGWRLSWIGMLNALLEVPVCCLLYDHRGPEASTGLWFGWSFALSALIGLNGAAWTVYTVSEAWLTGGDGGLFSGLCMTALLLGIMAWLLTDERRKKRSAPTV